MYEKVQEIQWNTNKYYEILKKYWEILQILEILVPDPGSVVSEMTSIPFGLAMAYSTKTRANFPWGVLYDFDVYIHNDLPKLKISQS